jgi:phosphoglycolate phosphatase
MHLFFDLDGTITDSAPGIITCLNHALAEMGEPPAPPDRLRGLIGTPLRAIFERVLKSADAAAVDRAVVCYRARFDSVGLIENRMFPGMTEALHELHARGHRLQVVTAKPVDVAQRVVEHFRVAGLFDAVHGPSSDDPRCDKADYVAAALSVVERSGGRRDAAVMIGDRVDDILAARAHGVRSVAVQWGYGSRDELVAAYPTRIVEAVSELLAWVASEEGARATPR